MADLTQALARELIRDRERSVAAHSTPTIRRPDRRPHRVAVRCGYWLISIGCRLVAPDLTSAAH
jgi:hypothetical protein